MNANCDRCHREPLCNELDKQKVKRNGKCVWFQEETGVLSNRNWT